MADLLVAGGLGYLFGRATYAQWEGFIKNCDSRMSHLSYDKIIVPVTFYKKIENAQRIYSEAVYAYLYGLPNASIPASFRCIELGLKKKYQEVEGKSPKMKAYELIEWSEKYLGNRKELAHGFRFLRNLIHEDVVVEEQDALEALRHITILLNLLFPFETAAPQGTCNFCNTPYKHKINRDECFIGNVIFIPCNHCLRNIRRDILP